ncbi:hypothetical protein BD309DRAFT_568837 [Dichomitus squalens]|uniref:Uncharacterized protein n=1 Tax=Dichomitus squalens TaxID=114155 RepID=A0A4Q9P2A7_9APHY|nr:hypothetical protein BD311DRAFT_42392 [Dichomitus squalens]TBU46812.1 hypothetical protein BD309DRAFT_568837 [Dichomitus squalens]TBU63027.1 hypothetical protein BD310DRAFT_665252 [Dichomitus squalens]
MVHTRKAELVPASSFSEPSEPSQLRPDDKPKEALAGEQEENPQLVAHKEGRQSGDAKGVNARSRARGGTGVGDAKDVDERKRKDVAGGFGVAKEGQSKL